MSDNGIYVLFRCMECNRLMAWPDTVADGRRCDCRGPLYPIGKLCADIVFRNRKGQELFRDDGLTPEEGKAMDALVAAWNAYLSLPRQHPNELKEFAGAIHRAQDLLAVRIARREYPKGWPIK